MARRACSGFEQLFLGHNVRLYAFAAVSAHVSVLEPALRAALSPFYAPYLTVCPPAASPPASGSSQKSQNAPGFSLELRLEPHFTCETVVVTEGPGPAEFERILTTDEVRSVAATEPLRVCIFVRDSENCCGVGIDFNHAVMDGLQLAALLQTLATTLTGVAPTAPPSSFLTPATWPRLPDVFSIPSPAPCEPTFLPVDGPNPVRLANLVAMQAPDVADVAAAAVAAAPSVCHGSHHVWLRLEGNVFDEMRRRGRDAGASVTGILCAAVELSLASRFFEQHPGEVHCSPSVSVLVGMKHHLKLPYDHSLAVGSVTIGRTIERSECDAEHLPLLAAAATSDIRQRIARNEHIVQALALSEGRFGDGCPEATLEISNLGALELSSALTSVHLAQRFDAYQGVSILVHSEAVATGKPAQVGALVLSASVSSSHHTLIAAVLADALERICEWTQGSRSESR
eukprot:m.308811 g.308811  ORF g.308811 m.308811 type:complete len:457 (-) comp21810_c0_seq1:65-1435(-)